MSAQDQDLGFSYSITKKGEVRISHQGRMVTLLRGRQSDQFRSKLVLMPFAEQQQALARITGNYKHGNEHDHIPKS